VATALLVAGSTLNFLDTLADFVCGSFQLTHMSRDDTLLNWLSHGGKNEDKTLLILKRSQRCYKG